MADCFLRLDQVEGESEDQEFKNQIDVNSWHWGVTWRAALQAGLAAGLAGASEVQSLTFEHTMDKASAGLMSRCARRMLIPTAELTMRRAGGKAQKYLTIKLEKVRVMSVDLVHDAAHTVPAESVVLRFDRVEMSYTPQGATGASKSASTFQWQRMEPQE